MFETSNGDTEINSGGKIVYFFMTIVLQIISFIFLFNYKSSEYIVYIFSFIVFCLTPFLWIKDLVAVGIANNNSKYYSSLFKYKQVSLLISSVLIFVGLILVLLTNEKIRQIKVTGKKQTDKKDDWERSDTDTNTNLNTLNTTVLKEQADKKILILYTTIVTLSWGLIFETFSKSETFGKKKESILENNEFHAIGGLLNIPYSVLNQIERSWLSYSKTLNMTPLLKSFVLYCTTFCLMFFGLFFRIRHNNQKTANVRVDNIKIVNVGTIFNAKNNNSELVRDSILFIGCLFVSVILFLLIHLVFPLNMKIVKYLFLPAIVTMYGIVFSLRKSISKTRIQQILIFLESVGFSLLGTPVVIGIIQLCADFLGLSLQSPLTFPYIFSFVVLLFLTILSSIFTLGLKWIHKDSYKNFKLLNALIICMAVSLFISLTPTYMMFSNLFNLLKIIIEGLLVFIVPSVIVILSGFLLQLAYNTFQLRLVKTDG